MANNPLRIDSFETVLYDANENPLGAPESAINAIRETATEIARYPEVYYGNLKKALSEYTGADESHILMGNGSSDLLRLYASLVSPKKALLPVPCFTEYENVLNIFGCDIDYFELEEENDFRIDVEKLSGRLAGGYDILILGNPSNPSSQLLTIDELRSIAQACIENNTFLIIDEMYIEFVENYKSYTAIELAKEFDNIAVLRSVSKYFAVPGLRFAYSITTNDTFIQINEMTSVANNISLVTAAACTEMLKDHSYISRTNSTIHTERNLIVSAMSTCKSLKLYKPYANFVLCKILKDDVDASEIAYACNTKGLVIRNCSNIRGLDGKYFRICFMNPRQNDLLVNTILEKLK